MVIDLGESHSTRRRRRVGRVENSGGRHLHLADPNGPNQPLRQLLLRLRLHNEPHIDGHARHVPQREVQDRVRDGTAPNVNVNLEVVTPPVVVTRQRFPQQARAVVPNGLLHDPRSLHDPVHQLEPLVPEPVVAIDEPV